MIYFDNAATTWPKPKAVMDSVDTAIKRFGANPGRSGHGMAMETGMEIFKSRQAVSGFFGAKGAENVCFTLNTTYAVNMALKGVLQKGDHVIISSFEHNAVYRTVHSLAKKGVTYDIAEIFPYDSEKTVKSFERLIRPNTKMLACMYASNVFGLIMPIDLISSLAKAYKLLFFVDAAQAAGALNINVAQQNIDYLCFSPHKGLYCPSGTGVLIINNGHHLETIIEGGTGSSSLLKGMPDFLPDRMEAGTQNVSGIIAIKSGIDFVSAQGIESIAKKEIEILSGIYDRISQHRQIELYTRKPDASECTAVLSFNIKGKDSVETASKLNEDEICVRAGLHCAPLAHKSMKTAAQGTGGTVRISLSVFNTKKEADILCQSIEKNLKS